MRPALLVFLLGACLHAQQAGVSGVVVDQSTGQPLQGVHVRLLRGDFGQRDEIDAVYGGVSDSTGHIAFDGLKQGVYLVYSERAGYVQVPAEGAPATALNLKTGEHITDFKIIMAPRGVIAGRVVDEFGDPVDKISVQAESVSRGQMMGGSSNSMTDDRGEFRLTVLPGKYYVKAMVFAPWGPNHEIRTDGTPGGSFVTTYHPSAASTGAASAVQVGAGQDLAGIEIRLLRAGGGGPARSLTVSGTVIGTPADGRSQVMLRYGEADGQFRSSQGTSTDPGGKFRFTGMQPGFYEVTAYSASGKTSLQSRPRDFHLDASDENDVQLMLLPGDAMAGTLAFVGEGTMGVPPKTIVRLQGLGSYSSFGQIELPAAEAGKDGSFQLGNIMPGKFRVVVEPMPANAYVKAIEVDGKAASEGLLDFTQGVPGSRLAITVDRDGGRISGRILDSDGQPFTGLLNVFLITDPKKANEGGAARVTDGKYSFEALRPGKYRLFAIDLLKLMTVIAGGEQEDMLKPFFDASEEMEIKGGDRLSKDITAFSKLPEKK